ncbi:MAG: hypothetical protein J7599_21370 [Niabella sp.]|nr:hypothetical protein [Niabella sp.]
MRDRKGGPAVAGPVRSTAPLHSPTPALGMGLSARAGRGHAQKKKTTTPPMALFKAT